MMAYQQMTFSYGKDDQVSYLQVATDMVRRPKRRMSRLSARGISNSIPTYRRSAQQMDPILFCANSLCIDYRDLFTKWIVVLLTCDDRSVKECRERNRFYKFFRCPCLGTKYVYFSGGKMKTPLGLIMLSTCI
jgi:hypothetical protein